MNPEDSKLAIVALATAIGGGFLVKLALDEALGPVQPAYAREFEEAHARAYGLSRHEPDTLSEVVAFSVALGASAFFLSQASDWAFRQAAARGA